jgi:hypothetical protein
MRHLIEAELAARSGDPQRARESEQAALAADPRNQHARFLVVRREFAALSGAGGSEAARAAATGLEGPALAVLRGWRASLARDWRALAALESELARSRPTDPWYADAVALRAQQRLKLHRSEPDRVRDALRLIDAALVANQELNLYTQRAVAGIALGDRNVFVESAGGIVKSVVSRLDQAAKSGAPLEPSERAGLRENLTGLARELGKKLSHEDGDRAHTVRAAAVRAIARIDASAAGTPAAREAARPTR